MMLFAKAYPDEVAGLVLVDATPYYPIGVCLERFSEDACGLPDSVLNGMPPHERAEALQIEETQRQVREAGPMPDIPVVLLVGPTRETVHWTEYWLDLQQAMASEIPQSTLIVDHESGHHIHFDNPQLVIDAITGLLAQVAD